MSLALQASGSLQPRLRRGTVLFGRTGLSYGNLRVTDARGRVVPAWLSVMRREVLIQVDDARAAYPLRIDPLIARGTTLTPSDQATGEQFGFSVALSADGSTVLIGGPDSGAGSAWVFSRSGSGWSQQGAKLTSPDGGAFGYSVALSADGNTALIGSPNDNPGSAWIFNRSGSVWTQEAKLTPADETSVGYFFSPVFGSTVALSADGNTALIGSPGDTNNVGAASVFTRSGSAWTQQGSKLTVSGGSYQFGATVSLSADGSTALIGGHDTGNLATGWVFTRAGSAWTQGAQLTSPDGGTKTLALSSDGNTVLIGASGDAWVFARSGSAWAQQAKLTASDATGGGIGDSVALSSDGNTALIAGTVQPPGSIGPVAAMWLFTRSGSAWAQQGGANFTGAVSPMAFSSDATTAAISDLGYNGGAGGVDMFANVASTNSGGGGGTGGGGTGGGSGGTGGGSNNGGGAVNPSHLRVKISKATISKKHRSAKFAFRSTGSAKATRFQCALVSQTHGKKRAKPHFSGCKSGKAYKHLRHGKYVFEVRALTGSAIGPVARRAFSI